MPGKKKKLPQESWIQERGYNIWLKNRTNKRFTEKFRKESFTLSLSYFNPCKASVKKATFCGGEEMKLSAQMHHKAQQ